MLKDKSIDATTASKTAVLVKVSTQTTNNINIINKKSVGRVHQQQQQQQQHKHNKEQQLNVYFPRYLFYFIVSNMIVRIIKFVRILRLR